MDKTILACTASALLATSCTAHIHPISEEGRTLCRERAAELAPGTSMDERQRTYRLCLNDVDDTIRKNKERSILEERKRSLLTAQAERDQRSQWASLQERFAHCKVFQQDIIQAEKARIRALGPKMMADKPDLLNEQQKEIAIAQYEQSLKGLSDLIPERMRAGRPLLPDSVEIFSRCSPSDFN